MEQIVAKASQQRDTQTEREYAARFGALVRERRDAARMTQDDLALATGVGRRFIIELEAGKPSCQLGKSLIVAAAVGLRPFDLMTQDNADNALLPDLPETAEEPSRG
jgi:transcriptional regulator with XRE-family HTH domain